MAKKTKTPTQKRREYKLLSKTCFFGQFLAVAAPYIVVGGIKFDDYFIEYNGTKMSIACVIAFIVMGAVIWAVAKKKLQATYVSIILGLGIFIGILFLIDEVVYDLKYICTAGLAGLFIAWGLEKGSEKLDEKADEVDKGIALAKQEATKEAYQEEVATKQERKTVKVRVRKDK